MSLHKRGSYSVKNKTKKYIEDLEQKVDELLKEYYANTTTNDRKTKINQQLSAIKSMFIKASEYPPYSIVNIKPNKTLSRRKKQTFTNKTINNIQNLHPYNNANTPKQIILENNLSLEKKSEVIEALYLKLVNEYKIIEHDTAIKAETKEKLLNNIAIDINSLRKQHKILQESALNTNKVLNGLPYAAIPWALQPFDRSQHPKYSMEDLINTEIKIERLTKLLQNLHSEGATEKAKNVEEELQKLQTQPRLSNITNAGKPGDSLLAESSGDSLLTESSGDSLLTESPVVSLPESSHSSNTTSVANLSRSGSKSKSRQGSKQNTNKTRITLVGGGLNKHSKQYSKTQKKNKTFKK